MLNAMMNDNVPLFSYGAPPILKRIIFPSCSGEMKSGLRATPALGFCPAVG